MQRLELPTVHDIAHAAQQLPDVKLQPCVLEDPNRPLWVKVDQHVDITLGPLVHGLLIRTRKRGAHRVDATQLREL